MNLTIKITTKEFLGKMADFRFVRIDKHTGKINDIYYEVDISPEDAGLI